MNLVVFGASGKTGREVVRQALARGFIVTAFVRDTGRLPFAHANLRLVKGEITDPKAVAKVIEGQTCVISTLGVGKPLRHDPGVIEGVRTIAGYASTSKHGPIRFVISLTGNNGAMRFELLKAIESEL